MATKKVYYYIASIKEISTNRDVSGSIKEIFSGVFAEHCVINNNISTMTLDHAGEDISLDILYNTDNYLFARVGKAKDPSDAIIRDNATKSYQYVLSGEDLENKTLEICTYFLLDYSNGIVGFILGKSAPSVQALINIINQFEDNYVMSIENIASPDNIRALLTPGATLGKISYTYRIPSVEVLVHLGLTRSQITALGDADVQEIDLVIRNKMRKPLSNNPSIIRTVVNSLEQLPDNIKKGLSILGKTANSSSQPYNFNEQDIVYSIEVPVEKVEDGERKKLTVDEVANEVLSKLRNVYLTNRQHLIISAGIE